MPWIWLATVPLNLFVVMLYNRYLTQVGPIKMLGCVAGTTAVINSLTAIIAPIFPHWILFQFAWKDVYILLMFKQIWSLIHSSQLSQKAKYLYGLIYAMGTIGAVCGSLIPGFLAVELGSKQLFFATLPLYLFLFFFYRKAVHLQEHIQGSPLLQDVKERPRLHLGFSLIGRSPFLLAVVCLVLLMQASVGLMEFQFNAHLEKNILDLDGRTAYMGQMLSLVNMGSGVLQLVGAGVLVHFLGMRGSHMMVPLILLTSCLGLVAMPSFGLISFGFVLTKAIDFSLFGILREMLYIPLKTEEKFQAKAVIDVFVHRSAKALVSVGILVLNIWAGVKLLSWVNSTLFALLTLWVVVVWFSLRRHLSSRYRNSPL